MKKKFTARQLLQLGGAGIIGITLCLLPQGGLAAPQADPVPQPAAELIKLSASAAPTAADLTKASAAAPVTAAPELTPLERLTRTTPADQPPVVTSHFTKEHPASRMPMLRWAKVKGGVVYELIAKQGDQVLCQDSHIYINGYNLALPETFQGTEFTWQVRALNLDRQPMTAYSQPETAVVDLTLPCEQRPLPTSVYDQGHGTVLLYPVYTWIPVHGAASYQVELLDAPPEKEDTAAPSSHRVAVMTATGFDCYDDEPRFSEQPFYWRVLGLDAQKKPVGIYSRPVRMLISPAQNYQVATLGDSITHGGGSLSYAPADWEYSYQYYLKFDTINLGESGDTSASTLERFDADVLPFHPEYLIIMTGTNSLRSESYSAESVIADLEGIKNKCLAHGIKPVFLTLPPINPANIKKAFNEPTDPDWIEKFKQANDYIRTQVHIDLSGKIPEGQILPTALALDGIHLDIDGKKLMAQAVNEQWDQVIQAYAE